MLRKRNVSLCFYFVKMYWLKNSLRVHYTSWGRAPILIEVFYSAFFKPCEKGGKSEKKKERKKERKKSTSLICFESWTDHIQGGPAQNNSREGGFRLPAPPIMSTFFSF